MIVLCVSLIVVCRNPILYSKAYLYSRPHEKFNTDAEAIIRRPFTYSSSSIPRRVFGVETPGAVRVRSRSPCVPFVGTWVIEHDAWRNVYLLQKTSLVFICTI